MHLKGRRAVALVGVVSLAFLALATACTSDAIEAARTETREVPGSPDVTFYVVAFHWGWGVFDDEGHELDGIRVQEGATVELYAVNAHANAAIGRLPAPVAAAIGAIEWDGERVRREIAEGRLPDPQVLFGMSLDDVLGHGDADHDDADHDAADHDAAEADHDDATVVHEGAVRAAAVETLADEADSRMDSLMPAWQMPWQGESDLATHGFLIPWYGVARKLEPDASEAVRVVFTADRPGAYEFQCVVYCGFGHQYQARGMLFVEAAQ